jgi:diguanylate cyclase (GGDEF)-like protein
VGQWLTKLDQETPQEIRSALVGMLFGTTAVFVGAVTNTMVVAAVLAYLKPSPPFFLWLLLELLVGGLRFGVFLLARRRAAQGRSTPTDLFLLLTVFWAAILGYGGYICAISGDWVAIMLVFLSLSAMVSGICTRNLAAPRLVVVMLVCALAPGSLGALLTGQPAFLLLLLQLPFYLFSMNRAVRWLNAMLISTMMAEREQSYQARHDLLTGLLNRAGLFQALKALSSRAGEGGLRLFYLDLDGFKPVNDEHGHEAGDQLLMQVAARLQALAGPQALIARMGGDEFVLIDEVRDEAGPAQVQAIVRAMGEPFALQLGGQDVPVRIGASVGWAELRRDGSDVDLALRQADTAMYEVKRARDRSRAGPPAGAATADLR